MQKVLVLHAHNTHDHREVSAIARRFPALVGRDPRVACVLDDERVSKIHASYHLQDNQLLARDASSVNGTFARGRRLSTDWTPLGPANVPHKIQIGDWEITGHVEERASVTEEIVLSERLGIRYVDTSLLEKTATDVADDLEGAKTIGESLNEAASRLEANFKAYEQKALELYTQLSERLGRLPPSQRAAECAYFEKKLPGLTKHQAFAKLLEQHREAESVSDANHAAGEGLQYLARRYVGRETSNAQEVAAFVERITATIDATTHGHAPLLASLEQFETDLSLERTISEMPHSPDDLARSLLDWKDPSGQTLRAYERSFAEVAMHHIGMVNSFMLGVKALLRELSPETMRRQWRDQQKRRDPVTRLLGTVREGHGLLALYALRYSDLADEDSEAFRVIFGREFAQEYARFKRQEIPADTSPKNGSFAVSTPYRDAAAMPTDYDVTPRRG